MAFKWMYIRPMTVHKITLFELVVELFDSQHNEQTNQHSIELPKVVKPTNNNINNSNKTLGTIIINIHLITF